jgi:surface protein
MFYGCRSLQSVPLFNTADVTTMLRMFYGCNSLQSVPILPCGALTSALSNTWASNTTLSQLLTHDIPLTHTLTNARLAREDIVDHFGGTAAQGTITSGVVTLSGAVTPLPAHLPDATYTGVVANWDDSGAKQRTALTAVISGTGATVTLSGGSGDTLPTGGHAIMLAFRESRIPDIEATGALSTRTDDTDGVITLVAPHQVPLGAQTFTLTWDGGTRTTTGTRGTGANQNVLTITGGAGDNLPAEDTEVTVSYMYVGLRDMTGGSAQTVTLTGNWGAATLSDAEKALATNKNWVVTI